MVAAKDIRNAKIRRDFADIYLPSRIARRQFIERLSRTGQRRNVRKGCFIESIPGKQRDIVLKLAFGRAYNLLDILFVCSGEIVKHLDAVLATELVIVGGKIVAKSIYPIFHHTVEACGTDLLECLFGLDQIAIAQERRKESERHIRFAVNERAPILRNENLASLRLILWTHGKLKFALTANFLAYGIGDRNFHLGWTFIANLAEIHGKGRSSRLELALGEFLAVFTAQDETIGSHSPLWNEMSNERRMNAQMPLFVKKPIVRRPNIENMPFRIVFGYSHVINIHVTSRHCGFPIRRCCANEKSPIPALPFLVLEINGNIYFLPAALKLGNANIPILPSAPAVLAPTLPVMVRTDLSSNAAQHREKIFLLRFRLECRFKAEMASLVANGLNSHTCRTVKSASFTDLDKFTRLAEFCAIFKIRIVKRNDVLCAINGESK